MNPSIVDSLKTISNDTSLEVRTGYFALCTRHSGRDWACSRDVSSLTKHLQASQDPANLVWQVENFKDTIVFYGLM